MAKSEEVDPELREWSAPLRAALTFARVRQLLTQAEVAERMGIGVADVRALEDGFTDPRMSTIRRWAWSVGVVIHYRLDKIDGTPLISTGELTPPRLLEEISEPEPKEEP